MMTLSYGIRIAVAANVLLFTWLGFLLQFPTEPLVGISVIVLAGLLFTQNGLNYLSPNVVLPLPWLLVLAFTLLPISALSTSIGRETYVLILSAITVWYLIATLVQAEKGRATTRRTRTTQKKVLSS